MRSYYWRNPEQKEIDIVEEESDDLRAYECKYGSKIAKLLLSFNRMSPHTSFETINPNNVFDRYLNNQKN